MKIIGLTGGIASGKSTVSRMLSALGAHIVDADQIAREIVTPGSEALSEIVAYFGQEILTPDGALKRGELARIVFNDPEALRELNRITHPRIIAAIKARIKEAAAHSSVVVLDAALLIELNLETLVNETWLVYVQPEIQLQRIFERESISRADAEKIISAQLPVEKKIKAADICIDNSGTLEALQQRITKLWNEQVKT